ncbi:hypothetical protein CLV58_12311 [Spirosoma oryzae]|uniref:Uncharacterized protein n=1 Tax=Spirosoma oryzae TaxID=1469603 RepID=A0A2T0SCA1_9BACT|nr:hypothetical protein [Spirosoma oryzae]PRY31048.1 hypothetical protein CLV58_12311 [Spirosoma oryzae]
MNRLLLLLGMLLTSTAYAQTKMASPALVKLIEGITSKTFTPDTTVAGLSDEAIAVVTKEPIANWSLPQTPSPQLSYQNLIVGKQSYRLVVVKNPQASLPVATLLHYTTAEDKPTIMARGTLQPKKE